VLQLRTSISVQRKVNPIGRWMVPRFVFIACAKRHFCHFEHWTWPGGSENHEDVEGLRSGHEV
jgi:hypothetical protein